MKIEWKQIREQFELPPGTIYLNNGSFGPSPKPVLDALEGYIRELNADPGKMLGEYRKRRNEAKESLGSFTGMRPEDFIFVTNVTVGMNMIARGLRVLKSGDEVLTTDQEYGAVDKTWDFVARRRNFTVKHVPLPLPPADPEEIVDRIITGITPRTKVLYLSHITSLSGLILPIQAICAAAKQRGVITAVDGAHGPGMIPLSVEKYGCDFYTGNCHKWLCAPKGTGFLWASPRMQELLDPLVVSWGWKPGEETFLENFEHPGTHDLALFTAVKDAVVFQQQIGKEAVSARGRKLNRYGRERLTQLTGVRPITPEREDMCCSLSAYALPTSFDQKRFAQKLREKDITIPNQLRDEYFWFRLSTHIYNTREEIDTLVEVVKKTLSPK